MIPHFYVVNLEYDHPMRLRKNIAISDTGFVFNPTTGDSYSVNGVGMEILKSLRENLSSEEILSRMTSEYDIDAPSLEKYYFDFISMLKQFELLDEEHEN